MPQLRKGPKALNTLLEKVYNALKEKYEDSRATALAWIAARKAGWKKKGDKWVKASDYNYNSLRVTLGDLGEFSLNCSDEVNDEDEVVLCLQEPELDENGVIILNEKADAKWGKRVTFLGTEPPYLKDMPELTAENIVRLMEIPHFSKIMFEADYKPPDNPEELSKIAKKYIGLKDIPIMPVKNEIYGVPIDVDSMIAHFGTLSKKLKPQLSFGHLERMLEASDYPSFGYLSKVYKKETTDNNGDKVMMLMGEFENVPEFIGELIINKQYTRVSPELYPFFPLRDGEIKLSELKTIIVNGKEDKTMPDTGIPEELRVMLKEKDNALLKAHFEKLEGERKEKEDRLLALSDEFKAFKEKMEGDLGKVTQENSKLKEEKEQAIVLLAEKERAIQLNDFKKQITSSLSPTKDRAGFSPAIIEEVEKVALGASGLVKLSDNDKEPDHGNMVIKLCETILSDLGTSIIKLGDSAPGEGGHEDSREPGNPSGAGDPETVELDEKLKKITETTVKLRELSGKRVTDADTMRLYSKIDNGEYTVEQIADRLKHNQVI